MYQGISVSDELDTMALGTSENALKLEYLLGLVDHRAISKHDFPGHTVYQFKEGRIIDIEFIEQAISVGATPVMITPNVIDRSSGVPKKTVKVDPLKVWCSVPDDQKEIDPLVFSDDQTWEQLANSSSQSYSKEGRLYWLMEPVVGYPDYFQMQVESPIQEDIS